MKRKLSLLLMVALILTLTSNQGLAEGILIAFHKFEMIENGKPTNVRIVAKINIFEDSGKLHVIWDDITIRPEMTFKKVVLVPDKHSTFDGSISNVKVGKDYFSFTIHTFGFLGDKRDINIVGKKKQEGRYEITGIGIWWSDIVKETMKTEYRTIDKIILPYNEVY